MGREKSNHKSSSLFPMSDSLPLDLDLPESQPPAELQEPTWEQIVAHTELLLKWELARGGFDHRPQPSAERFVL